jgi:hypothetical protein
VILATNRRVPLSMVRLSAQLNGESRRAYLHKRTFRAKEGVVLRGKMPLELRSQLADFGQEPVVANGRLDQMDVHIPRKRPGKLT